MFLDIAIGIFAALGLTAVFQIPLTRDLIVLGPLFALSPDLDYLIHLFRGGSSRNDDRHREVLHHPLIFIPVGMLGLSLIQQPIWAVLFAICALGHLVHDSIGIGWGVQWFYPISTDHYSFLYWYQPRHHTERHPRRLVYRWRNADIEKLAEQYGDPDWIKNLYLRFHPYAVFEYAAFIISVLLLTLYLKK